VRVLMVGLNVGYLDLLDRRPDIELLVVEEPSIAASVEALTDPRIAEVRTAAYQQVDEYADVVRAWHAESPVDVIVPGMEYAVVGAAALGDELGLRSPGQHAARVLCDKLLLRGAAARLGIDQPRFAEVKSAVDVRDFISDVPVVVKPANRRASVGVIRIDSVEEAAAAFEESVRADEGYRTAPREFSWRYMVEQYVGGTEVSVESLWSGGRPVFENVTLKATVGGRYFTEIGHVVPAPLDAVDEDAVLAANRRLLAGVSVRDGVFHSEWKLEDGRVHLIECAARPPGDLIPQLIERAYGFNLYEALLETLAGRPVELPSRATRSAGVRFFRPPAGRVAAIRGSHVLDEDPRVFDHFIRLEPGDEVDTFENSWHRVGYFAVDAADHDELDAAMEGISRSVVFEVDPA